MSNIKAWLDFERPKYEEMFNNRKLTHDIFKEWVKELEIKSALEIGGGLSQHKALFKHYLNIDINKNLKEDYNINEDFLNYRTKKKYELVFSHAVLDHIKNPNEFILKSIRISKKYVFHSIYRGLQRQSLNHLHPIIDKNNYLYNQLSEFEIKRLLKDFNSTIIKLSNKNVILIVKH